MAGDGVNVGKKDYIAEMGSSGNSSGPHVHYEIRYNGTSEFIPGETGEWICGCLGVPKNYIDDSGGLL